MSEAEAVSGSGNLLESGCLNPGELTTLLRAQGALGPLDSITALTVEKQETYTYRVSFLSAQVRTKDGETARLLVLKTCDTGQQSGPQEVEFYRTVASGAPAGTLATCWHAAYSPEQGRFSLLFEDLSATHGPAVTNPLDVPCDEVLDMMLDVLAALQIAYWDCLERSSLNFGMQSLTEVRLRTYFEKRCALAGEQSEQDRVEPETEQGLLVRQVLRKLPAVIAERLATGRHLTLVHGDAHGGNFLVPHAGSGKARLIDWPNWRPGLVTDDLAYMIAAWPGADQERALESWLPQYHLRICAGIAADGKPYSSAEWRRDFALSAGWTLLYCVGLLGEIEGEWPLTVLRHAANLARKAGTLEALETA